MDRVAIVADFVQPPKAAPGDWTVTMSAEFSGSDSVDVRHSKSAVLLVPRGRALANGSHGFGSIEQKFSVAHRRFRAKNPVSGSNPCVW